jgi:hypothetical protein
MGSPQFDSNMTNRAKDTEEQISSAITGKTLLWPFCQRRRMSGINQEVSWVAGSVLRPSIRGIEIGSSRFRFFRNFTIGQIAILQKRFAARSLRIDDQSQTDARAEFPSMVLKPSFKSAGYVTGFIKIAPKTLVPTYIR